ncbi:hypothetical protein KIN20_035549 [Parelaphostrongylus tenuis]|uniref:Sex-regulated protein janus-B n=1 Tax=Parelaphostrongylus tenuis TaxID=148309 RepID=A0AAD5RBW3_PARTN|nr:hypothetical protein KIN20_035549 [Parelaphostrongylus tenuis]
MQKVHIRSYLVVLEPFVTVDPKPLHLQLATVDGPIQLFVAGQPSLSSWYTFATFSDFFHSSPISCGTNKMPLSDISDVDIDPSGTFKYILIQCSDKKNNDVKYIVRGYYKCNFHADILKVARNDAGDAFKLKCVGGGRIKHESDEKRILVYGYSQGFGQADHSITVDILKKRYPDYQITFSNEGY